MVVNGSATVSINGLECGELYTIIAGGTLNGALIGPRLISDNRISGACVMITPSTTTTPGKNYVNLSADLYNYL